MGKGGALGGPQAEHQAALDRRVLRQEYRKLLGDAVEGKEQLQDAGSGALKTMLEKVELLRDKVEKPREHAVDADVFCHLTECGLTMVSRGHAANQGRTPAALIAMLRQAYGGDAAASSGPLHPEAMQWAALGASAAAYVARAPGVGCMLGPMDVPPKARAAPAQRRQRAAEPSGEVVHAQELATAQLGGEQDKQETDRNVLVMWDCLQRAGGAARFVPLVLNHDSFAQTVENIFTLSFLVRDRRVSLQTDEERGTLVNAAAKGTAAAGAPMQLMLSFDMEGWEELCAATRPADCLMPHRGPGGNAGRSAGGSAQRQHSGGRRRRDEEDECEDEEEDEEEEVPVDVPTKRARRRSSR